MHENRHWGRMLWAYRAVFTQANVGGGGIAVNVTANERMELIYGLVGQDDYAADRTVTGYIKDSAGNIIGQTLKGIALDNERVAIPASGEGIALSASTPNEFEKHIILGKGEVLAFTAVTLVQNETFTLALRALITTVKPTITTTGSGGTVTVVTTYDKVI